MKPPRAKAPATNAARRLREKLNALIAAPGTADEGKAARTKLDRLEARFDFGQVAVGREGLFAGSYQPANDSRLVATIHDWAVANAVKWAIEQATGIKCAFYGNEIRAQATEKTAGKLAGIAATITDGFGALWQSFRQFPTVSEVDRSLFVRGLYDGMMNEIKPVGQPLPARASVKPCRRAGKRTVGHLAGIAVHPYAVALDLGRQIRFNAPLPEILDQLENMKPKEIQ